MHRIAIAVAAAAALTVPALACSCVIISPEEQVAQSAAIFIGVAKSTTRSDEEGSDAVFTIFAVKEMLKGEPADEIYVFHPEDQGGNCGVDFTVGKEVLVLGTGPGADNPLQTNLCQLAGANEAELRAALKKSKP